ncbi:MAG: AAA family ATPase [Myxococcales bacterium]|nr:AAA family ATPase [Myxococcales bacterium]
MDESTVASLRAALEATPENASLRAVLLRALAGLGRVDEALELLGSRAPEDFPSKDDRVAIAELLLAGESPARAVQFADTGTPEGLIVQARAYLELDARDEAQRAYREAVLRNPTLEDVALKARLTERVRTIDQTGETGAGPRLKVIANDDTDETEVDRLLQPEVRTVTFADVGGLDGIKRQIEKRIILPFQKPSLFRRFRKKVGGGILLYGPPGCGKTLLARATAGQCGATFLNVAISDILDMYIGESERKLHAVFERARASTPAVMFFDELEALAGKRRFSREGTSSKLVSQFLSEMDGFAQNNRGVLILGATNVPWALDPAFRRPGRFDRVLFVPPPDREARAAILERLLEDRPIAGRVDVSTLARKTSGFSGADLEQLVESAVDEAIEASLAAGAEVPVTDAHLKVALADTRPTTLEWLTTARNYARFANEGGQYDEVLTFLRKHGKG